MSIVASGDGSAPADPSRVRYLAFLLDDISRGMLLAHVHALGVADEDGWTTHADHVTFFHTPSAEQLASFPWGVECEMEVMGFACDQKCRAVQVDVPSWVPVHPQAAVPHVTVSCAPGTRALESDAMLMRKLALGEMMFTSDFLPLKLTGKFGGVTMSDARVYAQPGVMDAATRTAVAAVMQADAAADAARAEARRVESEKAEMVGDTSALERRHELEGHLSAVPRDAGADDEADADCAEAELALRELGLGDPAGLPEASNRAPPEVPSGSASRSQTHTVTTVTARGRAAVTSRATLGSLFPDVPDQVIDDALRACDGNENAAASRLASGRVPPSVPAYGCLDVVSSSIPSPFANGGASSRPRRPRRRAGEWYPRADAWARPSGGGADDAASAKNAFLSRLARDARGGLFEWARSGRDRERERDVDVDGDPTAETRARGGVVRFHGRGADVPGAFSGSDVGAGREATSARASGAEVRRSRATSALRALRGPSGGDAGGFATQRDLLPELDLVRLKQRRTPKADAARQSDEHRAEAAALFAARARFVGLARAARARGDGRAAKDLFSRAAASAERAHGHEAKAQLLASAHRNDGARGGMEETDLHGADAGAATDKVARVLSAISELKMSALRVIYGRGVNSERGRARLGPAVREFLAGQNIQFTEARDGGSLVVPLS